MADNRTMAQLLQAPTEGYEDAIVIPEINANFELKHGLINLVQNKQFFGHDKEDPHAHIRYFNKITSTMKSRYHEHIVAKVSSNSSTPGISPDVAALTTEVSELKNLMKTMLIDKQKAQAPATVKAVEQSCVTCGGAHSYKNCPATDGQRYQEPTFKSTFQQASCCTILSRNTNSRPPMVSNQIRPPGFPPIQNNQNRFNPNQGNNFNQNRGTNFNQNRGSNFNQGQVYQPPTNQPPVYQAPPQQMQGVSKTDFENYVKANDKDVTEFAKSSQVPEKLEDPRKFLIPCALQELDRTNAFANSGASINLLPHSIYKQLGLGALKPTRMTLELAEPENPYARSMGKAAEVVVRAKALIDLYEEKLTLRVGSDELVFYAEKSEKSKNKQFAHAISIIDFSKDEPFSGSSTNHSDALPPSSSPVKTSDNLEEFADKLTLLKKGVQEENFQVYSNPLFEFDDDFNSSNENPLFNEMVEDVKNENSNVLDSDEPVLLNTPLSDKVECSDPEVDIDEIDTFLAMEVSSNFEECYFDSEGDVIFLENLLSDDTTHNLAPQVISDLESIHNTSITFSPRSDPLHPEFAGELITLPSRIAREHEDYLSRMTLLCEISTSRSQENVHANPSSIIESLPVSLIPVEDSDPVQEEIDIFLVPDDLIPPGVENDDSEDEDNELPNLDYQDNPSSPRPPPEPPDVCLNFKPDTAMNDEDFNQGEIVLSLNVEDVNSFTFVIWTFLPFFTYPEDSPVILSLRSEDFVFDPGISTFHFSLKPVPFALPKDE
ncbi:hypothetical protein Tco_0339991 [Tanacetum coccineum]